MIDSHCHLADEVFAADLDGVVERARGAGVDRALIILAAGDAREAAQAARVGELWPGTCAAIGVHPHVAWEFGADAERAAAVVRAQVATTPAVRAIGEIGLDYHYDFSPRDVQQAVFRAQLRVARELSLPVIIHTREADGDTLAILRDEGNGRIRGVLHCFTGDAPLAGAALELGFFVSFAGIVTFPKAGALREVARGIPADRLLAETDSPFLAPVPYRGKRNEPAWISNVVAVLADVRATSAPEIAALTSANFYALFQP
jgi:TatD DNase family protein